MATFVTRITPMSKDPDSEQRRGFEPPVPMEDRLWRHPSELGLHATAGPRVILHKRPSFGRVLVAAALGLIGGTVVGVGALVATGSLNDSTPTTAVEQLAGPVQRSATGSELAIADNALPAVARIDATGPAGTRAATGAIVRDDGLMLTTSDVLDGAASITVTLDDGTTYEATVVGRDRRSDVGVIDIEATGLPVVALPDATVDDAIGFGDQVVMVDTTPSDQASPTVTGGFVSTSSTMVPAGAQLVATESGDTPMYGLVEVQVGPDATPSDGGAILLDGNGSFLGIVTARTPTDDPGSAVARTRYATPYDHARRVYEQVVESGTYSQATLAVDVVAVDAEVASDLNLNDGGLLVRSEPTDAQTVAADIRQGDVIVAINGMPVTDVNDTRTQLRRYEPGEQVGITISRSGALTDVTATLGEETSVP
jgi:S1-C subfamily serine protease